MATLKKTSAKPQVDDQFIISRYMHDVLENNGNAESVYRFCKNNQIDEVVFYTFFSSIEAIKQEIWVRFFDNAVQTMNSSPDFATYSDKNKLLTLYFTFFEVLTLNRSYVVYTLEENKQGLSNLRQLKQLRNQFKDFIATLFQTEAEGINGKISKVTKPVFSEGAWIQFLFLLRFWLDDTSKGFEKTDVAIEKSVNTAVDLLNTKPLENLIDLGKFLWNERKAR